MALTPVFVGGSQRSGTNLLQTLLCQAEAANPLIDEANGLWQIVQQYARVAGHRTRDHADYFASDDEVTSFYSASVERLLGRLQARYGPLTHLVLKYPHLTMLWPELDRLCGPNRYLCMVRDPRDVVASMITVGERMGPDQRDFQAFARRDIGQICQLVLSFYRPLLTQPGEPLRDRVLFVVYEQLVRRPDSVLGEVGEFVGLDLPLPSVGDELDTGEVDYAAASAGWRPWITALYGKAPEPSSIGRWRQVLDAAELAAVERYCGGFMKLFGYEPEAGETTESQDHDPFRD